MPDRFGFGEILKKLPSIEKEWLTDGIKVAQQEFKSNFEQEKDSEKNKNWNPVIRQVPPPILQDTGEMMEQSISGVPVISGNKAVLTIDPIDERGKGYAEYHQEGINQYRSQEEFQRQFITESEDTDKKLKSLLISILDKNFK